ncbi:unnamed protein product [Moneuplotes crassus]|uniref:Uncharacterized protein n=1 Tax=Euplotes crassus TaxID=5936 RepID=A0AAD2D833_EUPCR|nr:unnamed protein product [Moneuplotes crassus]
MSHELRSPVNHINGILDILKSYIDDEKCLKFINIAMSSTEMLMSKISDILDFSLLETNTCELNPIAFNIRNMLLHIEDILNLQFDHKMIVFNTYVHERVPTLVYYDYKRLKQILINLTYNALKYTKKGFVSVTIDCKPIEGKQLSFTSKLSKGENQCELIFSVADSGCGIEKKKKNQFQLFSSLNIKNTDIKNHSDMIKSSDLMGIGLAFCHKMLKKMDSELQLSSIKNIGSTFSFRLIANYQNYSEDPRSAREMLSDKMIPHKISEKGTPQNNYGPTLNVGPFPSLYQNSSTLKTKRSSSVFQNELLSNSKLICQRMTLKPIDEQIENQARSCLKDRRRKGNLHIENNSQTAGHEVQCIPDQFKFCQINSPGWYLKNIVNCNESIKDFNQKVSIFDKQQHFNERKESFNISEAFLDEKFSFPSKINPIPTFLNSVREGRSHNNEYDAKFFSNRMPLESSVELERTPNRAMIEESKEIEINQLELRSKSSEPDKSPQNFNPSKFRRGTKYLSCMSSGTVLGIKTPKNRNNDAMNPKIIRRHPLKSIKSAFKKSGDDRSSHYSKNIRHMHSNQLYSDTEKISKLIHTECGCPQILVVDDQIINRMILGEFGLRFGVISDEAENGQIAVQMYSKSCQRKCCGPYKIILMDLNMPVMDGIRATSKIMTVKTVCQKPKVIAVSAFCSKEEMEKCDKVGMCDFKPKPIDSECYKDLLIEHLSKAQVIKREI